MEKKSGFNLGRAIILGGSFIAFAIGSGFASGQEVLQFLAAYGLKSMFGIVVVLIVLIFMNYNFLAAGHKAGVEKESDVFRYFGGKIIGTFYDWFTVLFVFMSFVVMLAGAGATLNQHFHIPVALGSSTVAALAAITVIFGLRKMVDVIGIIGPIIIITACIAAILGIIYGDTGIARGNEIVGSLEVLNAGSNWFVAATAYVGFAILWYATFFAAIGKNEKSFTTAKVGMVIGAVALCIAMVIVTLALLANIELVAHSQIPLLLLLDNINHTFASIFSIIIFLGIYSTSCPLLWTVSNRLAKEKTQKYVIITLVLTALALFIALLLPFNRLVNIIYVINGYVGFVLVGIVFIRNIYNLVQKKRGVATAAVTPQNKEQTGEEKTQ